MNEQIILSKLYEYLKKKKIKYKKVGRTSATLDCIFCKTGTMQILPNTYKVNCFSCKPKETLGRYYTLIDIACKVENLTGTDEDILQYLKEFLKINVMTKKDEKNIDAILDFYEKNGFDLVPLAVKCPNCDAKGCKKCDNTGNYGKNPIEQDWTNKTHKDKNEWKQWIVNGLNIGVKCGVCSNLLVIDLDHQKEIPETIKKLMGTTLTQKTAHGWHLFYKYDKDFPKTRIDELKIDTETTGGQVVIYPSKTSNIQRKIVLNPIIEIPKEFKKFLLDKITVPRQTESEKIKEDINTEDFKIKPKDFALKNNNLEGICNSSFIKLGGILRKQLNVKQTGYVLHTLNKHLLEDPMPSKDITAMLRELDRYSVFDERELAHKILEHLKETDEMSRTEMAMTIVGTNRGEDKKRVDKALQYLVREGYITKKGSRYSIIKKPNWKENLINIGIPIDFKMPYFDDVMYFNWGDLILIGSANAKGKTHISMNIIKRLVAQGKKPCYLSLETGSRWAKIALQLGLKEGDFKWDESADATEIELDKDAITVIDWLCPTNYAEVDKLLMYFTKQLQKTKGVAIIFMQLRDNNDWLAKDLVKQFPSFTCKYIYDNKDSGEYGKFVIDKIREAKLKTKTWEIPCQYNWESKELKRIDELEQGKDKNDK